METHVPTAERQGEAGRRPPGSSAVPAPAGGASFWRRLARGASRLWQRTDWGLFAGPGWPERIMNIPVTDRFHAKQGRSTGRWLLDVPGRRLAVYLKRH